MPVYWLKAYAEMLSRMEVEEERALSRRTALAVAWAFGSLTGDGEREYREFLFGKQPKPKFASPIAVAQAMGIPVRRGND